MSKERHTPVSIMVQSVVAEINVGKKFTPRKIRDIVLLIENYIFNNGDAALSVDSVRRILDDLMACIDRSKNGPKLVEMKRIESWEECCAECSRQKNGSAGCMMADPVIKDHYFPEDEKLRVF